MDGSRVETDKLSSPRLAIEQTLDQYVSSEESIGAKQSEASAELEPQNIETAENPAAVETEVVAQPLMEVEPEISEVELLTDVQDLMRELEPEIEEQEEVELSY